MNRFLRDFIPADATRLPASTFVKAVESLQDGDVLYLGGGRLEITPDGAFRKDYCISNNDRGEKPIVFPLLEKKNVVIDGEGADMIFCGDVLPFAIDRSEKITIQNLSIDYRFPQYGQAKIVEADENHTVLELDGAQFFCRVATDGGLCFYSEDDGWEHPSNQPFCLEFDAKTKAPSDHLPPYFAYAGSETDHGFMRSMFRDVTFRQLGENRIGMYGALGFTHTPGNFLVMMHSDRKFPGIFVNEADDVTVRDVRLYHTLAMGVICQLSRNLTLERVIADVRENAGRLLSLNADATHFVNCRGKIVLHGCRFVKMMDDAGNFHGILLNQVRKIDETCFTAGYGHPQQVGMNLFRPGDTVRFIEHGSLRALAERTVESSELVDENRLHVRVREPLPDFGDEPILAENVSTAPEIHIVGCESGANRPRGFLLCSAGKTLVEECVFHNMNQGIEIGGEMSNWYESGAITDITIRNCEFRNSAYAGGAAIYGSAHMPHPERVPSFHGQVVIEQNRFAMNGKRLLDVKNVQRLLVRDNVYVHDPSMPGHGSLGENGFDVQFCGETLLEPAREETLSTDF